MDLTQGTEEEKVIRAKKMMLWFGIVSLTMGFAGWTSAYIVSSKRDDWISDLELPQAFFVSTAIIILSSITYILARRAVKKSNQKQATVFLVTTLVLGITFIVLQFMGFSQMLENGYYFTGPTSNIKMSYVFLLAAVHIAHVVAGLITLLVVMVQQLRGNIQPRKCWDWNWVPRFGIFWILFGCI